MSPTSAPGLHQALAHRLERGEVGDRDAEVVDGAARADAALLADDRLRRHLEHVERGAAAEVEDEHARVVALGLHGEGDLGAEHAAVPLREAVEVGGERRDVVEARK